MSRPRMPSAAVDGAICRANAKACEVWVVETSNRPPIDFSDTAVTKTIRSATARLGFPSMELPSGAGHDTQELAKLCPIGMIFVPCEKGISHNEQENAKPFDLAAGARVLAEFMLEMGNR